MTKEEVEAGLTKGLIEFFRVVRDVAAERIEEERAKETEGDPPEPASRLAALIQERDALRVQVSDLTTERDKLTKERDELLASYGRLGKKRPPIRPDEISGLPVVSPICPSRTCRTSSAFGDCAHGGSCHLGSLCVPRIRELVAMSQQSCFDCARRADPGEVSRAGCPDAARPAESD